MTRRYRHSLLSICSLALTFALAPAPAAFAQDYPTRAVTIVVNAAAGSSGDLLIRAVRDPMSAALGQPIIIENRPAAGGVVGAMGVKRADPDGYTLLSGPSGYMLTTPIINQTAGYDPIEDFTRVVLLGDTAGVIGITGAIPAKTLSEFVAYTKQNAGKVSFASNGLGSYSYFLGEYFRRLAGIEMLHVPYTSAVQAALAVATGEVAMYFTAPILYAPHVQSGKVRLLAHSGAVRMQQMPDVPPVAEAGFPALEDRAWYGLFAPKGTPEPIVNKLHAAAKAALSDPQVQKHFDTAYTRPLGLSPAEFTDLHVKQYANWKKIIRELGIKLQ